MMAASKIEGKAEAVPMYSINEAPSNIPKIEPYVAYKSKKINVNPCAEGLEDPVLLADESEVNDGADRGIEQRIERLPESDSPGCCRRYSCCFPLIIITLVWLVMFSAQAFEHCQDCISTVQTYTCQIGGRADYYCKTDKIQICCHYYGDDCKTIEYPKELDYKMGQYFNLSMYITIIICLIPCILPFGIPYMVYHECRNSKFSMKRQTVFDVLCTLCFTFSSLGCSWTAYKYYTFPQDRCASNSDLFGISTEHQNGLQPNIWIMSQTTYSSFFGLILFTSFSICGTITLILQSITKKKKKAAQGIKHDE